MSNELRQWVEHMSPKLRKRLVTLGLIAAADEAAVRSLQQHVKDYLQACRSAGMKINYEKIKRSQLGRVIQETRATRLSDLDRDRVSGFLQKLRERGRSPRTVNQNRATVIVFMTWCVEHDRIDPHRLGRIPRLNEELDRRRVRRAASKEELERFFAAVPEKRRLVYFVALLTGLRRGELRQLEARDFDLKRSTLTVRAEVGKSGKAVDLPLHGELVPLLRERLAKLQPTDRVVPRVPDMDTLMTDLEAAGIEYKDANGRQLDFHALRGTFATRLLRQGVPLSVARRLTRYASVKTLEKHYDKLGFQDAEAAMKEMPGLGQVLPPSPAPPNPTEPPER